MKIENNVEKAIKSYRFTVIIMAGVIVLMFVLFGYILLFQIPDIVITAIKPLVHDQVRAAFDEAIESTNTK